MFDVPGKGAQVVIIALLVERRQVSPGLDGVLFIRVGARAWKPGSFDRAGKEVLPRRLGEAGRAAHELEQQAQGSWWRYGQRRLDDVDPDQKGEGQNLQSVRWVLPKAGDLGSLHL
jgi:hypothetical protein